MKSLWKDEDAAQFTGPLGPRVYTSRLLGRDRSLVLHGGGNTSVKLSEPDVFGSAEEILYVKGSGWDLETIEPAGFAPVRLDHVKRLAELEKLSDPQMVNELATHVTRAGAPAPSIETILHGILPFRYVDHTHADAILSITNTPGGEARIREVYGDEVVVVGYVMPGFDLAAVCARTFARERTARTIGMVLMNHGIFSFADEARASYERMIQLVSMAEEYLARENAWSVSLPEASSHPLTRPSIAELRSAVSGVVGAPVIFSLSGSARHRAFARHHDIARISQQGPATPDHVIRTKRLPMLGRDVPAYVEAYKAYFERNARTAAEKKTMLDPAPRVVLDPDLGLGCFARSARDAAIIEELYDHTVDVILRAEALGGWRALPEKEIFDVEYWDLEQAKLRKGGAPAQFAGEIALVTGAASGIGKACVDALLRRGAAVAGLDRDAAIRTLHERPDFLGVECDLTDPRAVQRALDAAVQRFGGLDMLVLNAGIFPSSQAIQGIDTDEFRRTMNVNVEANVLLLRECHALFKLSPRGGRVVVIGSKNVPAPGPGAAAYSASKAAMNQIARVAALEWGKDGIRINTIHPNAVYDTALWTDQVLESRARAYNLSVEEYKRNNLLRTEVRSKDVAELAAEMLGPLFAKTTAAQIPVDGGNERVV
jgi:rhamnose utilization protein RhaD (predicted bifunctional aldolase and dehydrogenase)/NAD(P)-dependent dehydrogenase (short-subunit alcohol dehydrogenase family)